MIFFEWRTQYPEIVWLTKSGWLFALKIHNILLFRGQEKETKDKCCDQMNCSTQRGGHGGAAPPDWIGPAGPAGWYFTINCAHVSVYISIFYGILLFYICYMLCFFIYCCYIVVLMSIQLLKDTLDGIADILKGWDAFWCNWRHFDSKLAIVPTRIF